MIGKFLLKHGKAKVENPYVLTPYDFVSRSNTAVIRRDVRPNDASNYLYTSGAGSTLYAIAPVHLPHGAIVTKVTAWLYTAAGGGNVATAILARSAKTNVNTYSPMATCTTTGAGAWGEIIDSSISPNVIDNSRWGYMYYVYVELTNAAAGVDALLRSVTIEWV